MANTRFPKPTEALDGRAAFASVPWYDWFLSLNELIETGQISDEAVLAAIRELAFALGSPDGTIGNIPPQGGLPKTTYVQAGVGIAVTGTLANGGVVVSLATLADSGVGAALWKFTRDQFGRVEGTSAATTDDLTEGDDNLYFTDERAQDAVGAILQGVGGDVELHYADGTPLIFANLSAGVLADLASAESAVQTIVAGTNITVDDTDPQNPIVSATGGGTGTVTSVAIADTAEVTWAGSPITTSGTFTPTFSTNLQAWSGLATASKENAITAGTAAQFWNGSKVFTNRLTTASGSQELELECYSGAAILRVLRGAGTQGAPAAVGVGQNLFIFDVQGYDGSSFASSAAIQAIVEETWTGSGHGTSLIFRTTAVGSTTVTTRCKIEPDGRIYGTALHNNAGSVSGTVNQYIASGTYTPTLTAGANIASLTPLVWQWMRVGNVVTVSGLLRSTATAAANTITQALASLPIASDLAALQDAGGAGAIRNFPTAVSIFSDTGGNRFQFQWLSPTTSSTDTHFSATYLIL